MSAASRDRARSRALNTLNASVLASSIYAVEATKEALEQNCDQWVPCALRGHPSLAWVGVAKTVLNQQSERLRQTARKSVGLAFAY